MRKIIVILVLLLVLVPVGVWAETQTEVLVKKAQQNAALGYRELGRYFFDTDKDAGSILCSDWEKRMAFEVKRAAFKKATYECLRWAAEQGDVIAQFNLGYFCQMQARDNLDNVNTCILREAAEWYEMAAVQGHYVAMYMLSRLHSLGEMQPPDYGEALYWMVTALDADYQIWVDLDTFTYDNRSLEMDYSRAWTLHVSRILINEFEFSPKLSEAEFLVWVRQKVAGGNVDAKNILGTMYYMGAVVGRNYDKAYELLGDKNVVIGLGCGFVDGKPFINIDEIEQRASAGDVIACSLMAYYNICGFGIRRNQAEGLKWLEKLKSLDISAEEAWFWANVYGEHEHAYVIGSGKFRGRYLPLDYARAFEWNMLAAQKGDAEGCYRIGMAYFHGMGVKQDYAQAAYWLKKAAAQEKKPRELLSGRWGSDVSPATVLPFWNDASYQLSQLYAAADFGMQNDREALKWLKRAAKGGHYDAMYMLGEMYEHGMGVKQSYNKAFDWYYKILATTMSYGFDKEMEAKAAFKLADLYAKGKGVKQDLSEAIEMYARAKDDFPEAQYRIMQIYLNGADNNNTRRGAYRYAIELAENAGASLEWREEAMQVVIKLKGVLHQKEIEGVNYRLKNYGSKINFKYCGMVE